jgi:hypothetical protein
LAIRACLFLFMLFNGASIYYSTIQPQSLLLGLTAAFALLCATALFILPFRRGVVFGLIVSIPVFIWYFVDPPSNYRDWSPEYAIPATATVDGGTVSFTNIRDFSYNSPTEMIPHYYNASFQLDQLSSVDLISAHWSGDAISHLFLSFNFQDGRHLAVSIETRRQKRFAFSVIAGFFRHFELMYVVADERDVIGVRTDVRHERVFLYRLQLTPEQRDRLFMNYVREIERLAVHPRWYNTLTNNCTTEILARAQDPEPARMKWHLVLSGFLPNYAYSRGLLDTSVPFAELREGSLIIRPAGAQITDDFSQAIRNSLRFYPRTP